MICDKISLSGFRNIESAEVSFEGGVNILCGDNGQGKTNLMEAIYLASVGRSFRGADESEMIKFGSDGASVSIDFRDSIRPQNISMRLYRGRRRQVELNKVSIRRLSDVVGELSTVLFCPGHLSIIQDGPAMRRNYLDVAISQLRPAYIASLQRYAQILKNRNKLIRDAEEDRKTFDATIDFWSAQLAEEAAVITVMRAEYIKRVKAHVAEFFADMTVGREIPDIVYSSSAARSSHDSTVPVDDGFCFDRDAVRRKYLALLNDHHEREIGAGSSLWGIHKDDMIVYLNSHEARVYASQGQQRSLALALKLTEGEICREEKSEYPIFLFDDVLSELDAGRRAYLTEKLGGRQVIMTCCEKLQLAGAKMIGVEGGKYIEL